MKTALLVAMSLLATGAYAQRGCVKIKPFSIERWEQIDYSKTVLSPEQLKSVPLHTLAHLRGIIFGRHGRVFKEMNIQDFLESRKWYHANAKFSNSMLNDTERKNLDTVRGAEAAWHEEVKPGDLRFWMNKKIGKNPVLKDLASIHIMNAEIEAIHGKTFPSEPALQQYFDDRYWYKPDRKYKNSVLSETERANLKTLNTLEQLARGTTVPPMSVIAYADKPLPDEILKNQSLFNLRLMRNAFYALRGRTFKTPWLTEAFATEEWYQPRSEVTLSHIEQVNVAKILKRENEIHASLSAAPVRKSTLNRMFVEDLSKLRNEIYARHGKVFKQKWLQNYFASLPWYKANAKYSDADLNPVERKNVKTILGVEKYASSQFAMEEG